MRPLILIPPSTEQRGAEFYDFSLSLSHAYCDAIALAGGLPLVTACSDDRGLIADWVRSCDGVLLTGGDDVQPELYREKIPRPLRKTVGRNDPRRDLTELILIDEIFRRKKPLLAICRGMQILNVALGGSLFVDIRLEVSGAIRHNRSDQKDQPVHQVWLEPGSLAARTFGLEKISVNSSHHQGVNRLAPAFSASATSPDGVIEAMELKLAERGLLPYLLAVQFHPERLVRGYPEFLNLFSGFIQACVSAKRPL